MPNPHAAAARYFTLLLLPAFLLPAAPKKSVATARGENEDLVLTVTLYIDPAGVKEIIGSDLDGHYIVADVKVQPKPAIAWLLASSSGPMPPKKVKVPPKLLTDVSRRSDSRTRPPHFQIGRASCRERV